MQLNEAEYTPWLVACLLFLVSNNQLQAFSMSEAEFDATFTRNTNHTIGEDVWALLICVSQCAFFWFCIGGWRLGGRGTSNIGGLLCAGPRYIAMVGLIIKVADRPATLNFWESPLFAGATTTTVAPRRVSRITSRNFGAVRANVG